MPNVKKVQPAEYINQQIKIRKELMQQIDLYKTMVAANSRHEIINEIIEYFFNTTAGMSPAMQKMLMRAIPSVQSTDMSSFWSILSSDASDEEVARAFLDTMVGVMSEQVRTVRTVIRQFQPEGEKRDDSEGEET